ncbi:hypothetical protein FNV43_RR23717 [Rhamnella rubrinervis]|uniref:ABC1 atypical kinase-like domain-containing protein n=1 Tax=Rhamnella rubrinervis TaxID=2594499 RepID=A0A8K0DSU5_9ROSA|nr:hypothetical protein FNV43_RR23717 [Rhamnella rubrinervis]
MKELGRLFNGLSLIAKELASRSPANQDFQTLLRKALVSATDIAGLTRGKVSPISNPKQLHSSVVYFSRSSSELDSPSSPQPQQQGQHTVPFIHNNVNATSSVPALDSRQVSSADGSGSHANGHGDLVAALPPDSSGCHATGNANVDVIAALQPPPPSPPPPLTKKRRPRERRSYHFLRFAGLGAGLAWGTIQESAKRIVFGSSNSQENQSPLSPLLSPKNAERLALALCRMRGAALKLGQMLSIQDESLVPAPILAALDIVRQGADVMPRNQLNQVLDAELGPGWSSKLISFDYEPMAAASIGQVHRAVTEDGLDVAMKIQYPGVADSIESDIENVKLLLDYTNLIPEGLYLDRAMKVAKEELSRECDYELEAKNQKQFRDLLSKAQGFYVPLVVDGISSKRVLTTELVSGFPLDKVALLTQETRNYVGRKLLELTLMELFVFRFMQTDPNWSNFLYDDATKSINLIDFGAARDFPKSFVDDYLRMVLACANGDRDVVIQMSQRLGFLVGTESDAMLEAHVQAGFVVGLPFSKPGGYDFRSTNITQSISNLGATMLKHRLTPPPDEAYSLHRKLSGAFLACIKLGAVVPCRDLLLEVYEHYQFGEEGGEMLSSAQCLSRIISS